MKRFIAVFGIIVIITMHCLSFYPAKAAITSVDYGEMLNTYLGAAETALAASQGVTIDWSNLELPAGSDTWTDQQKAQYIVQYIGNLKKVGQHAIYDWLFGENNDTQNIISAETAAIGLSNNSNINTLDIKAQLDNILATNSQDHVFQRYSDKVIARWNEYNTNYINSYLDEINIDQEMPIPNPDPLYQNLLNDLAEYPYTQNTWETDFQIYSIVSVTSSFDSSTGLLWFPTLKPFRGSGSNPYSYSVFTQPITVNITSSDDNYIVSYSGANIPIILTNNIGDGRAYVSLANSSGYNTPFSTSLSGSWYPTTRPFPELGLTVQSDTLGTYTTLEEAIDKVTYYFRNVNLYVDGECWALSTGYNISSGLTFNVPDAVIDSGTDDGKIVAHPIYYPDAINTDKAIDIDLDKVVDAIASRIAQGADDITFDDLVDAGAAVKLDGTTLTDADTIVKDVSVPIARAKVDTIDGVVPTIDVVPPLPPLPPLTPGDYSGEGFSGMSVLARIINATVQGLPEPLILTFFGVVFGAVILGIIKILHH